MTVRDLRFQDGEIHIAVDDRLAGTAGQGAR